MSENTRLGERLGSVTLPAVMAGAVLLVSALHGALLLGVGSWDTGSVGAIVLAVASLLFAIRFLATRDNRLAALVFILFAGQLALLVVRLAGATPPVRLPLLQAAIVLGALATLLALLLGGTRLTKPGQAAVVSFALALGLFLASTVRRLFARPTAPGPVVPEWVGASEPHPILGRIQPPGSVLRSYYPDNPRGYFAAEEDAGRSWHLEVQKGSMATLEFPAELPQGVRVTIEKLNPDTTWLIQLEQRPLAVDSGAPYTIRFKARADRPRSIAASFAQAHSPWSNLGVFKPLQLTRAWQSFQVDFTASAADSNARIHLNLGGSNVPVEVSELRLHGPGDRVVEPALPPKRFMVRYAFNALGCRGRDYPLKRVDGITRIIVLGDSYTLGVGVHQDDTFTALLERDPAQPDSTRSAGNRGYEVINCGAIGYGTREQRLFYELYAAPYRPDVVLVMLAFQDDKAQRQDDAATIRELLQLDHEVRRHGGRLVVASFGSSPSSAGDQLTRAVDKGLDGTNIPVLDLSPTLARFTPPEGWRVHQFDAHPNQAAHAMVARELQRFLREKGVLTP